MGSDAVPEIPQQAGDHHSFFVKNTFLEVVQDHDEEDRLSSEKSLKRSNSDSKLSLSSSGMPSPQHLLPAALYRAVDGSSEGKSSRDKGSSDAVPKKEVNIHEGTNHLTWVSSSSNSTPRKWEFGVAVPNEFDLEESLAMYQRISKLCADGSDIRSVLSTYFADVDITKYVPCDPLTGERLSLGSVLHFDGNCKPCSFLGKNRCHKGQVCLYCHFVHAEPQPQRRRASKKTRMRLRKRYENDLVDDDDNDENDVVAPNAEQDFSGIDVAPPDSKANSLHRSIGGRSSLAVGQRISL